MRQRRVSGGRFGGPVGAACWARVWGRGGGGGGWGRGKVWVTAWPLLLAAGVGAVVVARRLVGSDAEEQGVRPRRRDGGGAGFSAAIVWGMSVVAPVVLFATHIRQWSVVRTFLRVS